ncbi:hypothetical protein GSI_09268 [Ganoderma sinense ZZ0214-1]|uniref:Uncharacterized protein n=1 Tax=Ganoderma sinense ZZ0214-1 TaxID=1077348 RepID=A0A2G8S606_9APHY|nr:hypothetical protein GSI_09268 [Ganoderma sinense ZZ0214-1]
MPTNLVFFGVHLVMGKLYANSIMARPMMLPSVHYNPRSPPASRPPQQVDVGVGHPIHPSREASFVQPREFGREYKGRVETSGSNIPGEKFA